MCTLSLYRKKTVEYNINSSTSFAYHLVITQWMKRITTVRTMDEEKVGA